MDHHDPAARDLYVAGGGATLAIDPVAAAPQLISSAGSPPALVAALTLAFRYAPDTWGRQLDEAQAHAVLDLIAASGWTSDWVVERLVAAIAAVHPRLVLERLTEETSKGRMPPYRIDALPQAVVDHSQVVADWLTQLAQRDEEHAWMYPYLVKVVLGRRMSDGLATALADRVLALDRRVLERVMSLLTHDGRWALDHPDLAEVVLRRAHTLDGGAEGDRIAEAVLGGMLPMPNGFAGDYIAVLAAARDQALAAPDATGYEALAALYAQAAAACQAAHNREVARAAEDED